jgi:hypothetical protein
VAISNLILLRECLMVRLPANIVTTVLFEAGVRRVCCGRLTAVKSASQSNSALGGCTLPSPGRDDRPASAASNAPIFQLAGLRPSGGLVKRFREIRRCLKSLPPGNLRDTEHVPSQKLVEVPVVLGTSAGKRPRMVRSGLARDFRLAPGRFYLGGTNFANSV